MTDDQHRDDRKERARNAVRVYDKDYVHELFGFAHPGSTRKLMSRHGVTAVVGYLVEDIEDVLANWDPDRAWPRPHPKPEPKPTGRAPRRRK